MVRKVAYLDLDAVAYTGASIAQKLAYRYHKKDGTEEPTEVFKTAALAKEWHEGEVEFGMIEEDEWERETITLHQPLDIAIKGVEAELKKWMDSVRDLWVEDCEFVGYLTCSGVKDKDVSGLEHRYQHNRYIDKEHWAPKPKPNHLSACRNHLINKYSWISMSPKGVEADAIIVGLAERRGYNACIGFKDKDLKQSATNLIDMNLLPKDRALEKGTVLGKLELVRNLKGVAKVEGTGFKMLCFQTAVGDTSDGYKGLGGFGQVAGYELFGPLESVEDCCKALVTLYKEKYPEGIDYLSWDGIKVRRSSRELLVQHQQLAYHERSSKDTTNPIGRYLDGDNPIYKH